jgi:hypothetical protein
MRTAILEVPEVEQFCHIGIMEISHTGSAWGKLFLINRKKSHETTGKVISNAMNRLDVVTQRK